MPLDPSLAEVVKGAIRSRLLDVHVALPGRVVSYDAAAQTATVRPTVRRSLRREDGERTDEDLPDIPKVPVAWPGGGGHYLHFPLAPGDEVLLVFSEADTSGWRSTGEVSTPGDLRRHSLSNPVAIPSVRSDANKLTDAPSSGESVLIVGSGEHLRVSTSGGTAELVAAGPKVNAELDTIKSLIDTWATAMDAWLALLVADAATFVVAAPSGSPGVGALKTATLALKSALAAWPSATVEVETLKAE